MNSDFINEFSVIKDLRQEGKTLHKLIDILFIAVAGFIAGADDWEIVVAFANRREDWFRKFLELPNGIPSISTFRRVFRMIDSKQFEKSFICWVQQIARVSQGSIVAIDGKTARGARDADQETSPIHIVSAWLNKNDLVLGQIKTAEKSNEITAIPELLDLLFIEGCIVTIDAMGTQKEIAKKIINDKKANYVLALKGNQPTLYEHVKEYFQICLEEKFTDTEYQFVRTAEKGHGRIEVREYYLITDLSWLKPKEGWHCLKSVGMAINKIEKKGVKTEEIRYFIASVSNGNDFANAVREHWGIESMHWQLDVTFKEDASRIRKDNGAENTAMLRKIALNILKLEKAKDEKQQSYKTKRFIASLDEEYLEKLLIKNVLEIQ
jgi:predicted transposase YbfD/YdcC